MKERHLNKDKPLLGYGSVDSVDVQFDEDADIEEGEEPFAYEDVYGNRSYQQGTQAGPSTSHSTGTEVKYPIQVQDCEGPYDNNLIELTPPSIPSIPRTAAINNATQTDPPNPQAAEPEMRNGPSIVDEGGVSNVIRNVKRRKALAPTIRNYSPWRLNGYHIYIKHGAVRRAQPNIEPWTAEIFVAVNSAGFSFRTEGIATYYVEELGVYLHIFWSISAFSRRRLGIKVTPNETRAEKEFDYLNERIPPFENKECVVKAYTNYLGQGEVHAHGLKVTCTMGNDSKTEALISIYKV